MANILADIPANTAEKISSDELQMRERRREAMAVLTASSTEEIARHLAALGPIPAHTELRAPQSGLVMLRGRIGGDGAPFNFGEAREQGRAEFDKCVLAPIRARLKAERERAAQHVAATKVEFFTLVRGEG
jgi:alpha-D-ribose 1-methylphosphonate 5-triphosphate synthase subunit PhnG